MSDHVPRIYPEGHWQVGDRIRLSEYGLQANLGPATRYNAKMRGTVVGVCVLPGGNVMSIRVRKDGYKSIDRYYAGFWQHVRPRQPR